MIAFKATATLNEKFMLEPNTTEIDKPPDYSTEEPLYCQFPNRLAITGIILDCIRQLFGPGANLLHPQLKDFFYAAQPTTDFIKAPYQVVIDDSFSFDLTKAGLRPAILVKAGTWQESRLAIGDGNLTGGETYTKKIVGSHTVQVIAKNSAQAELLAREVHGYLSHFGPLLREWLDLVKWEVPQLQEPQELEEQAENVIIAVGISYELIYSWEIKPAASRLLRQIVVTAIMNTDNNQPH